eukprot:6178057-Pleurochrysis_carterae.AAC.1
MGDSARIGQGLTFNADLRRSKSERAKRGEAHRRGLLSNAAPPERGGARPPAERASSPSLSSISRQQDLAPSQQND